MTEKNKPKHVRQPSFYAYEESAQTKAYRDIQKRQGWPFMRLYIRCFDLPSQSCNPMVSLFILNEDTELYHELGRTEVVYEDKNPEFAKSILVNKEKIQPATKYKRTKGKLIEYTNNNLRFVVTDIKMTNREIRSTDIIGVCDWKISDLLDNTSLQLKMDLTVHSRKFGEIRVIGEPVNPNTLKAELFLKIKCENVKRVDFFTESDPFLIFYRNINGVSSNRQRIYITEARVNDKEPYFNPIKVPFNHFCREYNEDVNDAITIEIWDWNSLRSRTYIGEVTVTIYDLIHEHFEKGKRLYFKKKKGRSISNEQVATCRIIRCEINPRILFKEIEREYLKSSNKIGDVELRSIEDEGIFSRFSFAQKTEIDIPNDTETKTYPDFIITFEKPKKTEELIMIEE